MSHSEDGHTGAVANGESELGEELPEISGGEPQGRRIGRYQLVYELGTGGMANVYLACVRGPGGFNKWFAIKRIHPHLAKDRRFVTMFLDEARIAASLQHPNVAQVFDLGEEDGEYFIAMEYLHGEHLGALMARATREWGRLHPRMAAHLVARAAEGLHHAHEATDPQGEPLGIVHRDVSPQNIFITYDGQVKLTDFGVAKAGNRLSQTQSGTLKGKLSYLAPEQALGQPIDRRADIFSLGIVLWEITTGRRLFRAETEAQTLMRVTSGRVRPPSEIVPSFPPDLEQIVLRALSTDPDKRHASAAAMARELDHYVTSTGEPTGASELEGVMHQFFPDRMVAKGELLRSEPGTATHASVPPNPSGASDSAGSGALPSDRSSSQVVAKNASSLADAAPASKRTARLAALVGAAVVAAGAVAVGVVAFSGTDTSVVRIETSPSAAVVQLDGRRRGKTPVLLEDVPQGEHTVTFEKEGYAQRTSTFQAQTERVELSYDLGEPTEESQGGGGEAPDEGSDAAGAPAAANDERTSSSAAADGTGTDEGTGEEDVAAGPAGPDESAGDAEGEPEQSKGEPGQNKGKPEQNKGEPEQSEAEPDREKQRERRRPGYISVLTRPWSKVWINGRFVGTTPLRQRVPPGVVTLQLQSKGEGDKKTVRRRVRPGQTVAYSEDL